MAPTWPRWTRRPAPIVGIAVVVALGLAVAAIAYYGSPAYTDVGYRPRQPVPYSHRLHAGELEIDCLYCHATVDRAPVAVVPPTQVCMNCHHLVRRDSPALAPIVASSTSGRSMSWVRVHDLPDYVFFDHRPHLAAGVGCATCHGRIDEMEVVAQAMPLSMSWCVDCHRDPDPHLRPEGELTDMAWTAPDNQRELGAGIRAAKRLAPPTDCTGCHR